MIHLALEMACPGDVIVVDGGGDLTNALIGEIMVTYACTKRLEGIVIGGAIRDSEFVGAGELPVYASGVTHRGPYKDGPGEVNVPISLAGMMVNPGDLVVGDYDGVLSIPFEETEQIHARATEKMRIEANMLKEIRSGNYDASWIRKRLAQSPEFQHND